MSLWFLHLLLSSSSLCSVFLQIIPLSIWIRSRLSLWCVSRLSVLLLWLSAKIVCAIVILLVLAGRVIDQFVAWLTDVIQTVWLYEVSGRTALSGVNDYFVAWFIDGVVQHESERVFHSLIDAPTYWLRWFIGWWVHVYLVGCEGWVIHWAY